MRRVPLTLLLFLACGLGHKSKEPCSSLAADMAWREAMGSSGEALRQAVDGNAALATLYEKRAWEWLLFSPPQLNDYGIFVLTTVENRFFDGLEPDPMADSALLAIARAESLRLLACEMVDRSEMVLVYKRCISEIARAEVFLIRAWKKWATDMGGDSAAIEALFSDPIAATMNLFPRFSEYKVLRATLSTYTYMPDWKPLSFSLEKGKKIMPGDTGQRVSGIQERLRAEGFYTGPTTGIYDSATAEAVKQFQKWHYLEEDGVVGHGTLRAMNIPRSQLISRIRGGLSYWRKPSFSEAVAKGGWVFRINIPEFTLYVYKDGSLLQKNKVAVGSASQDTNFTPTLRDTVEFIVINPKWNVPDRIFEEELLEEIYETGDAFKYIEKKNFKVASKKGKIWLVRDPGEGNALGRVKFLFPNRYNIYLHDTPIKSTFQWKMRAVSHGCIRLDGAIELAIAVLTQSEGWTEQGFWTAYNKTEKERGKTVFKETWVPLRHKIPIFIDYVLVAPDTSEGRVVFLPDIYNGYRKR
ncbi:MAG: L,D-transpeptidase family protein [candidate division WOR-3 bacterium]